MRIAAVVVVGAFMSILDTTIVNVALDRLAIDFRTGFADIQWVVTAYMLAMAAVIPLSGWVAMRFGPKHVFIASMALFAAASALCGFAWSLESLVAFRVLQGAGGGLLMPVGQMMLAAAAGPHRMGRVMSVIAVPMLIAPVIGPVLGGFLVDQVGWEWIFLVNVPVGVAGVVLAQRLLRADAHRAAPAWPLDVVGVALMAVGIPAITYGLAETGTLGTIAEPRAWGPIAVGLALTAAYALYALRRDRPLLNVRLFANGGFGAASVTAFALGAALFGGMILMPLYEQGPRGHTALETGLLLAPQGLGAALSAPVAGRLTDRVGGGIVTLVGLTILCIGTIPLTRLGADTPQWQIMLALFVRGLGLAGSMMPAFAAAYATLSRADIPDASSQLNVVQHVGGSIGSALMAVILANRLGGEGSHPEATPAQRAALPLPVRERLAEAYAHTHWWVLILTLVAFVPAFVLFKVERRARRGADAPVVAPPPEL
ncbi:MAG: multidrug efflux MFS transporter [Thermoleophilia bacterium]|nr:multidrug efflux MFS transporter [Thermoleophilia bacterium]